MSARLGFMNGFREQVERMEIRNKKDLPQSGTALLYLIIACSPFVPKGSS